MRPWVLGVDPGRSGAAVLLDPAGALAAWVAWWHRDRVAGCVTVVRTSLGERREVGHVSLVSIQIRAILSDAQGPLVLVAEDVFAFAAKSRTAAIVLARTGGMILGPVEARYGTIEWVQPRVWHRELLRTQGDQSKVLAARLVPPAVPGLPEVVASLRDPGHLIDAAGIAAHRLGLRDLGYDGTTGGTGGSKRRGRGRGVRGVAVAAGATGPGRVR